MNEYDLFDAFGGVAADLLERSERRPVRRLPLRKALIAAAAVMALAVTAVAAPAIRDWLFASGSELVQEGNIVQPDENGLGGGYREASYDVELVLRDAANAPLLIDDFRLPGWFEQNGWITEAFYEDPSSCFYASFNFYPEDTPGIAVQFTQEPFAAESSWDEIREARFCVPGTLEGDLIEQTITIGTWEANLYITPPWFDETVGGDPGRKTVIWSDGEYAYMLTFDYEAELSFIEDVVLSLESVDIEKYPCIEVEDGPMTPITTFYSLGMVPEGFALSNRQWLVNNAYETYTRDFYHHISLDQCVNPSEQNYGPFFTIEDTLLNMELDQRDFTAKEYIVDGVKVTIIREVDASLRLMWYHDDYCFKLSFSYDPGLTDEELLDYYRSVQPMPDFTDHLTD